MHIQHWWPNLCMHQDVFNLGLSCKFHLAYSKDSDFMSKIRQGIKIRNIQLSWIQVAKGDVISRNFKWYYSKSTAWNIMKLGPARLLDVVFNICNSPLNSLAYARAARKFKCLLQNAVVLPWAAQKKDFGYGCFLFILRRY